MKLRCWFESWWPNAGYSFAFFNTRFKLWNILKTHIEPISSRTPRLELSLFLFFNKFVCCSFISASLLSKPYLVSGSYASMNMLNSRLNWFSNCVKNVISLTLVWYRLQNYLQDGIWSCYFRCRNEIWMKLQVLPHQWKKVSKNASSLHKNKITWRHEQSVFYNA